MKQTSNDANLEGWGGQGIVDEEGKKRQIIFFVCARDVQMFEYLFINLNS